MADINKPASVAVKEAEDSIRQAVTATGLAPCILEPILCKIHSEVQRVADQQYLMEKENYEKKLKEREEAEHVDE